MFVCKWLIKRLVSALEFSGIKKKKLIKLGVLGIDNAGKTTLMLRLIPPEFYQKYWRTARSSQQITLDNIKIIAKDAGERLFHQWMNYLNNISGIIYMIDASDSTKFQESKRIFEQIINMEEFKNLPVAVLGNKIDKMTAVSQKQFHNLLGIETQSSQKWKKDKKVRPIKVFMCSLKRNIGFKESLIWLQSIIR